MRCGRPRRAGDELLLREGWVTRDRLMAHMRPLVMPGQAARAAASTRKRGEDDEVYASRRRDIYLVGQRIVASQVAQGAVRFGVWIRDGNRYRHRDWTTEENTA